MKLISTITTLVLLLSTSVSATPLNIDANKSYKSIPEIEKFKYWYGDVSWGLIIYIGTKDISGFETELQLNIQNRKIANALLILGPAGMNGDDCVKRYREVIKILNSNYGHFKYQKTQKDPLIHDLISVQVCDPIRVELYEITTIWITKDFNIEATLLGDEDGFYIEINYKFRPTKEHSLQELKKSL